MDSPILRKEGKHYKFDDIEFWAEEGVICVEDARMGNDGKRYSAVYCSDFEKRFRAIIDEIKKAGYADERDHLRQGLDMMDAALKEARYQGDPTNPEIMRYKLRERKRSIILVGNRWN